jgi:hypothetical protein
MAQSGAKKAHAFAYRELLPARWMAAAALDILAPTQPQKKPGMLWWGSWTSRPDGFHMGTSPLRDQPCAACQLEAVAETEPLLGVRRPSAGIFLAQWSRVAGPRGGIGIGATTDATSCLPARDKTQTSRSKQARP